MIRLNKNYRSKAKTQTIIVLVECLQGGLKAGRFALNHLYKDTDQLVLLQIYKVPGYGHFLMRDLSKVLKNTSLEELTIIKDKLIEEFDIVPDNIEKMVAEGDIESVLKSKFQNVANPIVVIGEDTGFLKYDTLQKQISAIMKGAGIRNIFYIDDNITLINDSKIINIAENPETKDIKLENYLTTIAKKYHLDIEVVSSKGKDSDLITNGNSYSPSKNNITDNKFSMAINNILKKSLINTLP